VVFLKKALLKREGLLATNNNTTKLTLQHEVFYLDDLSSLNHFTFVSFLKAKIQGIYTSIAFLTN
jgi:hypothetical protein